MMALIEGPQGQQIGIAGDLATRKIGADGLMAVEGRSSVVAEHVASSDGYSERECWVCEPSVHYSF
jgi:hypothetical protein